MTSPKRKQPLAPTIGYGVLTLQAMTVPFAFAAALRSSSTQPGWMNGLFLAADLGALAALAFVTFGRRTHRADARFAPAVLVLPAWMAIALLSPLYQAGLGAAAMYSLYAVIAGALSAVPFLTREGVALFESDGVGARQTAGITHGSAA